MPDRDVRTIRDLILYQYAKIIARSALGADAKTRSYGFIKTKFRELRDGTIAWSEITREDWQLVEAEKACAYCGAREELAREHLVPRSLKVKPACATCPKIQQIHNQVWACGPCNSAKGTSGLYDFYRRRLSGDAKFYDRIPALVEKKYLKTIYDCHECAGTLGAGALGGDGPLTVRDVDEIVRRHAR